MDVNLFTHGMAFYRQDTMSTDLPLGWHSTSQDTISTDLPLARHSTSQDTICQLIYLPMAWHSISQDTICQLIDPWHGILPVKILYAN